jgi:hypothetical protein
VKTVHESRADLSKSADVSLDADSGISGTDDTGGGKLKVDGCKAGTCAGKLLKALERPAADTCAVGCGTEAVNGNDDERSSIVRSDRRLDDVLEWIDCCVWGVKTFIDGVAMDENNRLSDEAGCCNVDRSSNSDNEFLGTLLTPAETCIACTHVTNKHAINIIFMAAKQSRTDAQAFELTFSNHR